MGAGTEPSGASALLDLYDRGLPSVYGYLLPRCSSVALAEDLTAETFLAALRAAQDDRALTVGWLVTVARNKLVDHWRRAALEDRKLALVADDPSARPDADPWDERLDAARAHEVLAGLGPSNRAALTLRYLDGLSVAEVADHLGRSVHATEALLVRARTAFRRAYDPEASRG